MPTDRKERLPHILIPQSAETARYTTPVQARGKSLNLPSRERKKHAESLLANLALARQAESGIISQQKAIGLDAVNGIYLTFQSEPDFDLKFESLEFRPSGIELLTLKREGNQTIATVFVPDGKLSHFLKRVTEYRDGNTDKGKPKHQGLVAGISNIQVAVLDALWTDTPGLLPQNEEQPFRWEVWLRNSNKIDHEAFLREHAAHLEIEVGSESIHFLDRTVVLVRATKAQMSQSVQLLASFAELRKAKDTADFYTGMDRMEQQEWIDEMRDRIQLPEDDAPAICVLDTGVNRQHPLLIPVSNNEDMHSYDPNWGVDDRYGHGTQMAGLAMYGDLTESLSDTSPIPISYKLESVKVTPRPGCHQELELYGAITRESIARPGVSNPHRARTFCLAITTTDDRDRGKPSSWSAAVDALTSGYEDERRRLVILSAGNTESSERGDYPHSNLTDEVHDPGQAWNALTVGGYTEKVMLDTEQYPGWEPIAPAGDLSPSSCTSMEWEKSWPIKPDIVMEAGNMARNPDDGSADYIDEALQLLTTNHDFSRGRPLISFGDTSAASALASRLAAQVMATYPAYWPETIRALLVHSAQWTEAMKNRFTPLKKQDQKRQLLRYCGYGVPNENLLFWSAQDSLTLIAQDSLQPFMKESGRTKTRDINLHALPWPREALMDLAETEVEMRVTLSYFVEPNPGERGWSRKFRYQSHGLRFDVKRSTETDEQFRQRINKQARDEEFDGKTVAEAKDEWFLGTNLRTLGSIHSDIWRGTAASLAERGRVAVFPVMGWWKERPALERWGNQARYALIISIRTPGVEADIYTPVINQIAAQVIV